MTVYTTFAAFSDLNSQYGRGNFNKNPSWLTHLFARLLIAIIYLVKVTVTAVQYQHLLKTSFTPDEKLISTARQVAGFLTQYQLIWCRGQRSLIHFEKKKRTNFELNGLLFIFSLKMNRIDPHML